MGQYLTTLYTWAALNTDDIAFGLAEGLALLTEAIPLPNIHLIGHSWGAHIVGRTGRYFEENTGEKLVHITGLDPAMMCLSGSQRIRKYDAHIVEIIYSNYGVLGIAEPWAILISMRRAYIHTPMAAPLLFVRICVP